MRKISCLLLILALIFSLSLPASGTERRILTTPTGYQSAADVEYVIFSGSVPVNSSYTTVSNVVVNWGARGENATFLSTYAESYYTGSYSWDTLSAHTGGSGVSNAPNSDLYKTLQNMMKAKHTHQTSYGETRAYYGFTDCVANDYSKISSFYSGTMVSSVWNGSTYNREHTWPNSKGLGGNDENDIMMLRPTLSSENASRGNKAYGESGGYYDPGVDVRGDCARIMLYIYVRWGNVNGNGQTDSGGNYYATWGTYGVMESMDILLKWMEEDPVDTWEMGRNDAVQSITGVRNVFVDYPEYAWLLFGEQIPTSLSTPSGEAKEATPSCTHAKTQVRNAKKATCTENGYTGDTYCVSCGKKIASGQKIAATGHGKTELRDAAEATCGAAGHTGNECCSVCGKVIKAGAVIPATGEHALDENGICTRCGYAKEPEKECTHENTEQRNQKEATCLEKGYSGDTYCADCGQKLADGEQMPVVGHRYTEWLELSSGAQSRWCLVCNHEEMVEAPAPDPAPDWTAVIVVTAVVIVLAGGAVTFVIIRKKRA